MLPYNTGKYHETPEGIPMLHAVDHGLTETMLSLSPSSQFMYEPEVVESATCGSSQGSVGLPPLELNYREEFLKSEGVISPTVEGMTFQGYADPDDLFAPPADGFVFGDCLQLNQCSTISTPGMMFESMDKQDSSLCVSGKRPEFADGDKLQPVFPASLDNLLYDSGQTTNGGFDLLSDEISSEDRDKLDPLVLSAADLGGLNEEGIGNDWFEMDKNIYEMSRDPDVLLQDPVFCRGPTLTQLNSKDLDSACLDDSCFLEDLYPKTFSLDKLQSTMSSAGIDLASTSSKFPVGISSTGGAVTSPKFTTCTVTSFVTSVSTSGVVLPPYPTYVANEPLVNQKLCYLGGGVPDLTQKLLAQNQWASLFAPKSEMTTIDVNQCFVPVVGNKSQVNNLFGTFVIAGGAVSLVSSEDPPGSKQNPDASDASKTIPDENWDVIEHILLNQNSGEQLAEQNTSSSKSCSTLKMKPQDMTFNSHEELTDKESVFEDSDVENADVNSDEDDADDVNSASSRKEKKYFWQYNTQLKGPKGKRLCKSVETEDPHILHDFEDPVFDPEQNQTRYKHNGKARRGDGNDVTPNPHKLYVTGNELKKLNESINSIVASSEMPASVRAKLLKEKNKYASRACRLKKKAQHEANKLKLHGLELEHRQLMKILVSIKKDIVSRVRNRDVLVTESLSSKLETLIDRHLTVNVAGRTADYVNSVLQRVAKGDRTGGIAFDE